MLRDLLRQMGYVGIGRRRIRRLMRLMGIEAIYQKENTSRPHPAHPVHPYLLRNMIIDRPNQVWTMDITYLPMPRGFLYLVAVMDWYSRKIHAWKLSNTMHAEFCVSALQEAIAQYGVPEIMNTDQGGQFTSL
jgi:putative transposase